MSLESLVRGDAKIDEISAHLDALDPARRRAETQALGGADQRRLFECAASSPPLDLSFFVPSDTAARDEVVHFGRNSLPAFKLFEKRFCRPAGDGSRLFGFNEGPSRPLIGPGYFVAHETEAGDSRGAIVVDYYMVPDAEVATSWPPVRPNRQGLQRFVYFETRDYMRRVSSHVSIGQAHKREKKVIGTFILCRDAT